MLLSKTSMTTPGEILAAIFDKMPTHLKDERTEDYKHQNYTLYNSTDKNGFWNGPRLRLNKHCTIRIKKKNGKLHVSLELTGYVTTSKNKKATYLVKQGKDISPKFWERVTAHTEFHQKEQDKRERRAFLKKEDAKKLLPFVDELKLLGLHPNKSQVRWVKEGSTTSIDFTTSGSFENNFSISLGTNCNGEVILETIEVKKRTIDMPLIKKLVAIFGLQTYDPLPIQRSIKKPGELFDLSAFI